LADGTGIPPCKFLFKNNNLIKDIKSMTWNQHAGIIQKIVEIFIAII
jgi:hypothetical protein